MASRTDDSSAEQAYAAASAAAPVVAKVTASEAAPAVKPRAAAKPRAIRAPVAAKAAAPKQAAKPTRVKPAVVRKAIRSVAPARAAATRSTLVAAAQSAKAFSTKGQTMITDTMTKMTEEASKVAADARTRGEAMIGEMKTRAEAMTAKGQVYAKDAVEFSRSNLEAMVESAKITAKGVEAMGSEMIAFTKAQAEVTTNAAKRYAAVKSPTEFLALNTELSKAALETMVKQGSKTTEMTVKLANDAFQPISNRIAIAISKLKSAA